MQIQNFYNGLLMSTQVMVDAAAGGSLKSLEESQELFKLIASNNY